MRIYTSLTVSRVSAVASCSSYLPLSYPLPWSIDWGLTAKICLMWLYNVALSMMYSSVCHLMQQWNSLVTQWGVDQSNVGGWLLTSVWSPWTLVKRWFCTVYSLCKAAASLFPCSSFKELPSADNSLRKPPWCTALWMLTPTLSLPVRSLRNSISLLHGKQHMAYIRQ